MHRSRSILPLLALLAAAACGGGDDAERPDGPRTGAEADSAGMYGLPAEPRVTPAESASAARAVQAHADSVRAAVLEQSGGGDEAARARQPRVDNSVEGRYRACMQQAQSAEEPMRARLVAACERIRVQEN